MNKKRPNERRHKPAGEKRSAPPRSNAPRPAPRPPKPAARPVPEEDAPFRIIERPIPNTQRLTPNAQRPAPTFDGPFRVVIAVHRPRFRGRSERAARLVGWEITSLLNKQDPVGLCQKAPRPPDLLVLSGDFGRQRDYAIFRAVQRFRTEGMKLVGLVEDCETAPEEFPDSVPSRLCDVCLEPPYTAAGLRAVFTQLYEEMRGEPAPSLVSGQAGDDGDEED